MASASLIACLLSNSFKSLCREGIWSYHHHPLPLLPFPASRLLLVKLLPHLFTRIFRLHCEPIPSSSSTSSSSSAPSSSSSSSLISSFSFTIQQIRHAHDFLRCRAVLSLVEAVAAPPYQVRRWTTVLALSPPLTLLR